MIRRAARVAAVLGLMASAAPARAHIVSDREVVLLQKLPASLALGLSPRPDAAGYVRPNAASGWRHVEHQEGALLRLMDACARADSAEAEAAWLVIEAAMAHQRPAGDFAAAAAEPRARQLERTAWWIGQLCRAEIVVVNSPLQSRFRWRVNLFLPKLRRSVDWLVAAGDTLFALHAARPDLSLIDAHAFLLADGIYHEPRMAELGQRALVAALGKQGKDGALAPGPGEIAAHARGLTALGEIATYFPMPSLEEAAKRASQWLGRRVEAELRSGKLDRAARRDALLALAFQAERAGDAGLRVKVERWSGGAGLATTDR